MSVDTTVASIASAIGEPARAKMLFSLMDGHARTSTELAVVAEVSPSTASVHLSRLKDSGLVKVLVQGRHRYYSLESRRVARVLEGLSVLAGQTTKFTPNTPPGMRAARTCYDHMAGALGVALHDRLVAMLWVNAKYEVTSAGMDGLASLGIPDLDAGRRRVAFACLDWSERRPHLGGALGAVLLRLAIDRRWVQREADSRALSVTRLGKREFLARLGMNV